MKRREEKKKGNYIILVFLIYFVYFVFNLDFVIFM